MDLEQVVKKCRTSILPTGERMYRLQPAGFSTSLHYGKEATFRWDAPDMSYGVLYLASDVATAFAETFGHAVPQNYKVAEDKFIELADLTTRTLYELEIKRDLNIVDMTGENLIKLNLDAGFTSLSDYTLPQGLSKALYDAGYDGIEYQSRALPTGRGYALFETTIGGIKEQLLGTVLDWVDPVGEKDIFDILEEHGWLLVDNGG